MQSNRRPRHRGDWLLPVTAVCIALGALTAVQFRVQSELSQGQGGSSPRTGLVKRTQDMAIIVNNLQQHVSELERDLYDARVKINLYEERAVASGVMRRDFRNYKMTIGLLRAKGPGVHLVLDDRAPEAAEPRDSALIIHDYDILAVVNELRGAEAEAVAVSGQRVTPFSAIRCVGPVIHVNGVAIPSPYEIEAVGDPKVLKSALELPGGVLSQLKPLDIKVSVQEVDSLTLPAIAEEPKFRFARPVIEEEGT